MLTFQFNTIPFHQNKFTVPGIKTKPDTFENIFLTEFCAYERKLSRLLTLKKTFLSYKLCELVENH
jgi:hypothetical protein